MSSEAPVTFLGNNLDKIIETLKHDGELRESFLGASAVDGKSQQDFTFAIVAIPEPDAPSSIEEQSTVINLKAASPGPESFSVSVKVETGTRGSGQGTHTTKNTTSFALNARHEHWKKFFEPDLAQIIRPYQSYWGMLRVLGADNQVYVSGDTSKFARYARVWRITLDRIRLTIAGQSHPPSNSIPNNEDEIEDTVTGKYIWINHTEYGKVKIFYEYSGTGPQNIVFLHTAGSDSRQYHSLMNNPTLQEKCTMFAFDLPGHGRSSLGTIQSIDTYALTETSYIESIDKVIRAIKHPKHIPETGGTIVCGASMAGHICIALAIRASSTSPTNSLPYIHGSIPCEGTSHLPTPAQIYNIGTTDTSPSLLDPEKVCGMISPTSPAYYTRQIWWQYSSQAHNIFPGDLKFYFVGWDGRDRLREIDTAKCPVYMLTGEYDYSCTVEASRETAKGIKGAVFEGMKGLGHFPLTEDPERVLPYLLRAIEHIQKSRKE